MPQINEMRRAKRFLRFLYRPENILNRLIRRFIPIEQRSLGAIYKMLSGDSFQQIEQTMGELPNSHPAKAPYGIFKLANRQIWGNIAIGLGNRLGVFQNELVDKITKYNEIDLELPGIKPCAYFCIISDQDSSLEFLSSLFFSTLFVRLTNYARRHGENGRLPIKVNVCLDEFCNIGKILDFKKIISTVRSRNINCQVIIQSAAQLSDRYEKKEWEEIIGNADTQLFLGCNDQMTAEYISKKCGMVTIGVTNNSMPLTPLFSPVYNSTRPYTQTRSNTQRALLLPDEILRLPNEQVLVLLRGHKPLLLYKIIPEELPAFSKLTPVRIVDYLPEWKRKENEMKNKSCKSGTNETRIGTASGPPAYAAPSARFAPPVNSAQVTSPTPGPKPGGSIKYSFISGNSFETNTVEADPGNTAADRKDENAGTAAAAGDSCELLTEEDLGVFIEETSPDEIIG